MASQDPPGLTVVVPALSPTTDTGGIRSKLMAVSLRFPFIYSLNFNHFKEVIIQNREKIVVPALSPIPDTGGIRQQVSTKTHGSFVQISIHD